MSTAHDIESTLTDRYQTTVPESVRRALQLNKRDKLHYTILPGGEVMLSRADAQAENDPVLGQFLGFLEQDIANNSGNLQILDANLVKRIQNLVKKVKIDLDAPLSPDDE